MVLARCVDQEVELSSLAGLSVSERRGGSRGASDYA